ncbi:DUF6931 family protein [Endozoicomonadaceae bacterium StTr2]
MYLHIVNTSARARLNDKSTRIPPEGGVIGRSPDSMLCLEDNSCLVSRRHALISPAGNTLRITDLSANGLIINDAHQPLGKGRSIQLHDGDLLTLPGYQILVSRYAQLPERVRVIEPGRQAVLHQQSTMATAAPESASGRSHKGTLTKVLKHALGMGGSVQSRGFAGSAGSHTAAAVTAGVAIAVSREGMKLFRKNRARQFRSASTSKDARGSDDLSGGHDLTPGSIGLAEGDHHQSEGKTAGSNDGSNSGKRFDPLPEDMFGRKQQGGPLPAGFRPSIEQQINQRRASAEESRPDFVGPLQPMRGLGTAAVIQAGLAHLEHAAAGKLESPAATDTAHNALQASRNILLDKRKLPHQMPSGFNPEDTEAGRILSRFPASQEAKDLLQPDMSPMDFNQALINHRLPHDSMQFLAHAMTPRQAVWWGADCLDRTGARWSPEEENLARAARAWSYSPSERTLGNVAKALPTVPKGSPVGLLGQAALIAGTDAGMAAGAENLADDADSAAAKGSPLSALSGMPKSLMALPGKGAGLTSPADIDGSTLAQLSQEMDKGAGSLLNKDSLLDKGSALVEGSGIGSRLPGNMPDMAKNGLTQLEGMFTGTANAAAATEGDRSGSSGSSTAMAGMAGGLALGALGSFLTRSDHGGDQGSQPSNANTGTDAAPSNSGTDQNGATATEGNFTGTASATAANESAGAGSTSSSGGMTGSAGGFGDALTSLMSRAAAGGGSYSAGGQPFSMAAMRAQMQQNMMSSWGGSSFGMGMGGMGMTPYSGGFGMGGMGAGMSAIAGGMGNMMTNAMMASVAGGGMAGGMGGGMMPFAGGFGGFGGMGGATMPMPMFNPLGAGMNYLGNAMMTPFGMLGQGLDYATSAMMTPFSAMGRGLDYATNAMMSPVEAGLGAAWGAVSAPMGAVASALSGPAMMCSQMMGMAVMGMATVAMLANTAMMLGAGALAVYSMFSAAGTMVYSNYNAVTETYTTTVDDMTDLTEDEDPGDEVTEAL